MSAEHIPDAGQLIGAGSEFAQVSLEVTTLLASAKRSL